MSEIVNELGQRLAPREMKERAKEAVVRETRHLKDRIVDSPLAVGVLGGLVAAGLTRWLRSRRRPANPGYVPAEQDLRETMGEGVDRLKERAGEVGESLRQKATAVAETLKESAQGLKDKAVTLTDQATGLAHEAAEKIPSRYEIKQAMDRVGRGVGDEPLIGALAALAAGATVGLLVPLTDKERRVLEPYRIRAGEKLDEIKADVREGVESLEEKLRGAETEEAKDADSEEVFPTPPPTLQ